MEEVSGKFAKWVFESGISDGVAAPELLRGTGLQQGSLEAGGARIDWDDYVQMLENYHAAAGLGGMRDSAFGLGTSKEVAAVGRMAGLFISPRRLYKHMYRWVGNHFLRNVQFQVGELEAGDLKVVSEIDAGSRGSEVFFLTLTNVLAGTTLRIGREPAQVELIDLGPHRAEYRITLSKHRSGIRWVLGWPLRFARSIGSRDEILVQQQEEIRERQSAVDRQRVEFAAMIDSLADPLFIIALDGVTLFANRVARRWFGVPDPPGAWRPAESLDAASSPAWDLFIESSDPAHGEFSFRCRDRGGALAQLSFAPAQAVVFAGRRARLLIGRDVTVQRRVESQMREVAFNERSRLAAELHDGLGQQLTGISMRCDTVAKELETAAAGRAGDVAEIGHIARRAIEQARDLAHGLAAIDEGTDNLRRALVQHAEKLRRECGFEVALDLPESIELTAEGQWAFELLRIVQEACHNAVKHSGGGRIGIRLRIDRDVWTLRVADDGAGVPEGALDREAAGLGMGSMSYRARQLGGTLAFANRQDGKPGAEVVVSLPWGGEEAARREAKSAPEPLSGSVRILVADDQKLVLEGLVARLSLEPDFEICGQVSEQGEIVPAALSSGSDVAVLDMMMGAEDNLPVIRALRSERPTMGIVVVSMFHEEYYAAAAADAGADAYFMKQAATSDLVQGIRRVVRSQRDS